MDWKQLLASITGSVDEELRLRNAYLAAENRILRDQMKARRLLLTDAERKTLAEIGHKLGRQALQEIATISDQTVGNILKRQGLLPAPERKKTTTWREFIRLHIDMLLATDFFTHEVWRWCGLVIASLLCFLRCGRHNVCGAGRTLYDALRWMPLCRLRSLNVQPLRERGVRVVQQAALPRLILYDQGGRRPPRSAFPTDEDRVPIPQGIGKVVRMPAVPARQIRDGPMHDRHRDELLHNIHCAAA